MHCPACEHRFSQWSLRLNPFSFACPNCRARLVLNCAGRAGYVLAVVFGFLLAGFSVAMEEAGHWSIRDSIVFFGLAISASALPVQMLFMRYASIRRQDKPAELVGRSRLLLSVARGSAMGVGGLLAMALLNWLTLLVPSLPNARFLAFVAAVASGQPAQYSDAEAMALLTTVGWFLRFVLPVLSAILIGLLAGAVARFSFSSHLVAAATFAGLDHVLLGLSSAAAWLGVLGFLFALVGTSHATARTREVITEWRRSRVAA